MTEIISSGGKMPCLEGGLNGNIPTLPRLHPLKLQVFTNPKLATLWNQSSMHVGPWGHHRLRSTSSALYQLPSLFDVRWFVTEPFLRWHPGYGMLSSETIFFLLHTDDFFKVSCSWFFLMHVCYFICILLWVLWFASFYLMLCSCCCKPPFKTLLERQEINL